MVRHIQNDGKEQEEPDESFLRPRDLHNVHQEVVQGRIPSDMYEPRYHSMGLYVLLLSVSYMKEEFDEIGGNSQPILEVSLSLRWRRMLLEL